MRKFVCSICGYVYEEATGVPNANIAPGTKWEALPDTWKCPWCGAPKSVFQEDAPAAVPEVPVSAPRQPGHEDTLQELSFGELSAICSNLAKGCEKQYLAKESEQFLKLAEYFQSKTNPNGETKLEDMAKAVRQDLEEVYPKANAASTQSADRGALRVLVWSEKVTRMLEALISRYQKENGAFLEHTGVYVCDICGFICVGDTPPAICPVCKVPSFKILEVVRR